MLIVFGFLLLFFKLKVGNGQTILECSTAENTPTYSISEYTLLQSPNFPQSLQFDETISCDVNLVAKNVSNSLWIVFLSGALPGITLFYGNGTLVKNNYQSNTETFTYASNVPYASLKVSQNFTAQLPGIQPWAGFEAAIIPVESSLIEIMPTECPLSSKVFDFATSPNLVIPITFNYWTDSSNNDLACSWYFKIGPLQQLKVVIRHLEFEGYHNITLVADGIELAEFNYNLNTHHSKTPYQVSYFQGNFFNLSLIAYYPRDEWISCFMFISVVESSPLTHDNCNEPIINDKTIVYSNINSTYGYPAYQRCDYNITFPENYEAVLSVQGFNYEACCDVVQVTFNNGEVKPIRWKKQQWRDEDDNLWIPVVFNLLPSAIGSVLSFTSDGNGQGFGYEAILETYECVCGRSKVIMACKTTQRLTPIDGSIHFCDSMTCTYEISSNCANSYFLLDFTGLNASTAAFVVHEENGNGNLLPNSMFLKDYPIKIYFRSRKTSPGEYNIIYDKFWYIDIKPAHPNFVHFYLNETYSTHIFDIRDLKFNDALVVCAPQSNMLQLFTSNDKNADGPEYLYLYNDGDLFNFVGRISDISQGVAATKCFTIYVNDYPYVDEFLIMLKLIDINNNCDDSLAIYRNDFHALNIQSTSFGSCKATILSTYRYLPSLLWIYNVTATIDNTTSEMISFTSPINGNKLIDMNSNNIYEWINFGFFTTVIDVEIPASSEITLQFSYQGSNVISKYGVQRGLLVSPSYTGYLRPIESVLLLPFQAVTGFNIIFNVKYLYGRPDLVFEREGSNYTLPSNKIFSFNFTYSLNIYYQELNPTKNGFLIEYIATTFSPTTTTSSTIRTATTTTTKAATTTSSSIASSPTTSIVEEINTSSEFPFMTEFPTTSETTTKTTTHKNSSGAKNFPAVFPLFLFGIFIKLFCI